jgi:hypothetical protein
VLRDALGYPATTALVAHAPVAHAHSLVVLTLAGDKICAITRFGDINLFPYFALPDPADGLGGPGYQIRTRAAGSSHSSSVAPTSNAT